MRPDLLIAVLTLSCLASASADMASSSYEHEPSLDGVSERFARASVAFEKSLALKIKQLNGRDVYLFDLTGFTHDFKEKLSPDNVRYLTGTLNDKMVDAVLSKAAQGTLHGEADLRIYLEWAGKTPDVHSNEFGVFV